MNNLFIFKNYVLIYCKKVMHFAKQIRRCYIVAKSGLFDKKYYLSKYPEVKKYKLGAIYHYIQIGHLKMFDPSPTFSTSQYFADNPIVFSERVNPLFHFIYNLPYNKHPTKTQKTIEKEANNLLAQGVVYTCITGGYDNLIEHECINKNWDYVCFTDNLQLISQKNVGVWQIRPLAFSDLDNVRNARWHKTHPHMLFPDYSYSIWLDGNIIIKDNRLFEVVNRNIQENKILAVSEHGSRACAYKEGDAVLKFRKDIPIKIKQTIDFLRSENYPAKNGLYETFIIFQKHHKPKCIAIMDLWFSVIENYSRRDQLSFNYSLWKNNFKITPLFSKRLNPRNLKESFEWQAPTTHNSILKKEKKATTISIIIPVFNAIEDIKRCLASISNAQLTTTTQLIIIDDCSHQDTALFLQEFCKKHPHFKLIINTKNLGFVKSCNIGLQEAKGDIVVLLNSDTMIPSNFEERVLSCFNSNPFIGLASPLSNNTEMWKIPFLDGMNFIEMDKYIAQKFSHPSYPKIVCPEGFCFCIRRQVIDEIGFFDEIYQYGYCEENDYAMLAITNHWLNVIIDNLYVYHKRNASFSSKQRSLAMNRNHSIFRLRWEQLYLAEITIHNPQKIKKYIMQNIRRKNS